MAFCFWPEDELLSLPMTALAKYLKHLRQSSSSFSYVIHDQGLSSSPLNKCVWNIWTNTKPKLWVENQSYTYFQTFIRLRERLIYHELTSYLWPLIFWYILLLFLKPLVSSNFHSFHSLDFPDQYMLKMLSLVPCLSESF